MVQHIKSKSSDLSELLPLGYKVPTISLPGVMSFIPAQSHTFVEIDHEIISTAILLPSADSRRVFSYKRKHVHIVLVKSLVKPAQEKVWLSELVVST